MSRTLLSTKHLGTVCAVSRDAPLEPDDWQEWLSVLAQAEGDDVPALFRCGGGTPDARQRRALFEISCNRYFRIAVLTDSRTVLSDMAEFEWLGHVEIRGFSYNDFEGAFEYLNVSEDFYPGLERKLLSLTEQLLVPPSERSSSGVTEKKAARSSGVEHPNVRSADDEAV